jgi:hypothetical protein
LWKRTGATHGETNLEKKSAIFLELFLEVSVFTALSVSLATSTICAEESLAPHYWCYPYQHCKVSSKFLFIIKAFISGTNFEMLETL